MKTTTICYYLLLGAATVSCSTETGGEPVAEAITLNVQKGAAPKATGAKEAVGEAYESVYLAYGDGPVRANFGTCRDVVAFLKTQAPYQQCSGSPAGQLDSVILAKIIGLAKKNPAGAMAYSGLSPRGRASLLGLCGCLAALSAKGAAFKQARVAIVSYEATLQEDAALSATDLVVLRTTTAILRRDAALRKRKKPRDRDWELSIGHIAATAYGATQSDAEGVMYAMGAAYGS